MKYTLLCLFMGASLCVACGQSSPQETQSQASVLTELEEQIPLKNQMFKRVAILAEGAHKNDYRVVMESLDPRIKAQQNDALLRMVKNILPLPTSAFFCNGEMLNSVAEKALTPRGSLRIIYTDSVGEKLGEYSIDNSYCRKKPAAPASEVRNNIREDGVYTRRYLEKFIFPVMQAQIPNQITPEFAMSKAELGRKSSLILTLKYTPLASNMSEELAVDKAANMLQNLYSSACRTPETQELIRRLDMFAWQVEWNNKIITKVVASPNCR